MELCPCGQPSSCPKFEDCPKKVNLFIKYYIKNAFTNFIMICCNFRTKCNKILFCLFYKGSGSTCCLDIPIPGVPDCPVSYIPPSISKLIVQNELAGECL